MKKESKEAKGEKLDKAYQELTRDAFAVWIRMMIIPEIELKTLGIKKLAKIFKYSRPGLYSILKELQNGGYIRIESAQKTGYTTKIYIERKAMILGGNHFIRL